MFIFSPAWPPFLYHYESGIKWNLSSGCYEPNRGGSVAFFFRPFQFTSVVIAMLSLYVKSMWGDVPDILAWCSLFPPNTDCFFSLPDLHCLFVVIVDYEKGRNAHRSTIQMS